jgi:hypothetical protein
VNAVDAVEPKDIDAGFEQARIWSGVEVPGPKVATILVERERRAELALCFMSAPSRGDIDSRGFLPPETRMPMGAGVWRPPVWIGRSRVPGGSSMTFEDCTSTYESIAHRLKNF